MIAPLVAAAGALACIVACAYYLGIVDWNPKSRTLDRIASRVPTPTSFQSQAAFSHDTGFMEFNAMGSYRSEFFCTTNTSDVSITLLEDAWESVGVAFKPFDEKKQWVEGTGAGFEVTISVGNANRLPGAARHAGTIECDEDSSPVVVWMRATDS